MKNLLANEISKEVECRRQTPSVIAKLMGLDGMPYQQSAYKQSKRSSDGFHRKNVSDGSFRHTEVCDDKPFQRIKGEQPHFKDVYEVRESSRCHFDGCTSQLPANRRHAKQGVADLHQKFTDAEPLSTEEKLHEAIDVLDSNNNLFLKLLREPDSLFAKHMHDLHVSGHLRCGHVQNMGVSGTWDSNLDAIGFQTCRRASKPIDITVPHECQGVCRHHVSCRRASDSGNFANLPAKTHEVANSVPTKIVLLKPNTGASQKYTEASNSCKHMLSLDTCTNIEYGIAGLWGENGSPISLDLSAHKSQESDKLAKDITRRMRKQLGEISSNMPVSRNRGYYADESSHEASANDSSNESDAGTLSYHTPRRSFRRGKASASRHARSSVNKEGTKRLLERWKMSCRPEEIRSAVMGNSTLGEMLAISDPGLGLRNLDGDLNIDQSPSSFIGNSKPSGSVEPLGISSKDGWTDGYIRTLERSRSLPIAHNHIQGHETRSNHQLRGSERFLTPKEGPRRGREKGVSRDLSWKGSLSSGIRNLGDKEPCASRPSNKDIVNGQQGSQIERRKKSVQAKEPHVCNTVNLEGPGCQPRPVLNHGTAMGTEQIKILGKVPSSDNLEPAQEFSTRLHVKYDSSSDLHGFTQDPSKTGKSGGSPCLQYPGAQTESPSSSKESEQPSPISVLGAPFEDLSSGSECFERVSAELHGLRIQLQLLKLETGAYTEETASDEGAQSEYAASSQEAKVSSTADNWEAAYISDLLSGLNLNDDTPEAFIASWHSPEYPVSPLVFEELEKKHNGRSRPDRRLLFDCVNSAILKITRPFTNPCTWVPMAPRWCKAWFENELADQVKLENADVADDGVDGMEGVGGRTNMSEWTGSICCEIEKVLLDELISEVFIV